MKSALVIGYGNPLRRDDGVGPTVVRRLELAEGITAVETIQLLPEHIEAASRARLVVLVDAGVDLEPGAVRSRLVAPPTTTRSVVDLHELSPGALIGAARDLYGGCPTVWSVTIGAADLSYGEGLSPRVEEAVDRALAAVTAALGSR